MGERPATSLPSIRASLPRALNVQVVGEGQSATAAGPDTSTEPEGEGDGYYAKRQPPVILNLGQVQPQPAT